MNVLDNGIALEHPPGSVLVAYGLGQLADAELASIDVHLADCPECRQVVEGVVPDTLLTLLRSAATDADSISSADLAPNGVTQHHLPNDASVAPPAELLAHPRYRVGDLLGVGGMGAVYKAEHLLMERPVALKVLNRKIIDNPATTDRFRREVRAAARLTHPNIVAAFDAEQAGDVHFLVMEYVDGVSLARRAAESGPLPVAQACDYIRQAALGLQHAHERGMVHRDIKPQNLMLTPAGQIKILDFGLARFVMESAPADTSLSLEAEPAQGQEAAAIRLTHTGLVMGTPDYIAPEQARDSHLADIRADIYALGCTFYDLLAGQAPFPDGNAVHKVRGHLSRTPQPLDSLRRDVPPELIRIVERMMAKDPANRFQTPADVAAALTPFVAAPPPPRKKWPVLAAAAAFLAAIVFGAMIYIQTDNGRIVIETNDDAIAVMIQKAGGVKIIDQANNREYTLRIGEQTMPRGNYLIDVTEPLAGIEFQTKKFELKRGKEVRLTAKFAAETMGKLAINDLPKTLTAPANSAVLGKTVEYWLALRVSDDPKVRAVAVQALGSLARKNKELIPVLLAALNDDGSVSREAEAALVNLGSEAVPSLAETLKDAKSDFVLISAISVLGRIGPDAKPAAPALVELLNRSLNSKKTLAILERTTNKHIHSYLNIPLHILGSLGQIDPEIRGELPAEMRNEELEKSSKSWFNIAAPIAAWKQTGEMLKKRYPGSMNSATTSNDDGIYQGKPARHWLAQFEDADPKLRTEAIRALGAIALKNAKLIPTLMTALRDGEDDVGNEASSALRKIGPAAFPAILEILSNKKDGVAHERMTAALSMDRAKGDGAGNLGGAGIGGGFAINPAPIPLLVESLRIDDPEVRVETLRALGGHGDKAKLAVPKLVFLFGQSVTLLEDTLKKGAPIKETSPSITLPVLILRTIQNIAPASEEIIPGEFFQNPDPKELDKIVPRWRKAHEALAKLYPLAEPFPRPIAPPKTGDSGTQAPNQTAKDEDFYQGKPASFWLNQLRDGDAKFRLQAVVALGGIAQRNKDAIPILVEAMKDRDDGVGHQAALSLAAVGADGLPALLAFLRDETSPPVSRVWAIFGLAEIGPPAKAAVPMVIRALKAENPDHRHAPTIALGRIGPAATPAIPALIDLLETELNAIKKKVDAEQARKTKADKNPGFPAEGPMFELCSRVIVALKQIDPAVIEVLPAEFRKHPSAWQDVTMTNYQDSLKALKERYSRQIRDANSQTAAAAPTEQGALYLGKPAQFWIAQYQDAAPKFRVEAIEAIGNLAAKDKKLIPLVVAGLKDQGEGVGAKAAEILGRLGPEALPDILAGVDRKSPRELTLAVDAIAPYFAQGKAAVPMLTQALKLDDWPLRRLAMAALLRIGPDAKPAAAAVVEVMGITLAGKEIVAALENPAKSDWKLGSKDSLGLVDVLETLLRIDPDVRTALPEGIVDSGKVRNSSGINLSAPLPLWKQTHEVLKKRYPSGATETPSEAPKVEPGKVVPKQGAGDDGPLYQNKPASFWREQLRDASTKSRVEAFEAVGSLAANNKELVPDLVAGLRDEHGLVRMKAASVLGSLGPTVLPEILRGVDRESPKEIASAADAIARIGPKAAAAVPMLTDALKFDEWTVQLAASHALGQIGTDAKPALPALVRILGERLQIEKRKQDFPVTKDTATLVDMSGFTRAGAPLARLVAIIQRIDPDAKSVLAVGLYRNGVRTEHIDERQLPGLWRGTLDGLRKRYPPAVKAPDPT